MSISAALISNIYILTFDTDQIVYLFYASEKAAFGLRLKLILVKGFFSFNEGKFPFCKDKSERVQDSEEVDSDNAARTLTFRERIFKNVQFK